MSDFFNFGNAPTEQFGDNELIPKGTLAWAIITVRPAAAHQVETPSKATEGNAYLDLELTICEGPYAKRKVWDKVGVKGQQTEKGQKYVNQGRAAIRAMLESGRGASEQNPAGYKIDGFMDLNGLKVAIKVDIEKGTNGYSDKNKVAAYLSPNPQSSAHKAWNELISGEAQAAIPPAANVGNVAQPQQQPAQEQAAGGKPSWL